MRISRSARCKAVDVRRCNIRVTVAPEFRAEIIGDNPQNVGLIGSISSHWYNCK